jgi:hypothetical protein
MAGFAGGTTDERARHGLSRAREPSAGSKTTSARSTRTCCQCGTASGTPVPGAVPCNGSLITRSLMRTPRIGSLTGTQIPSCPEPCRRRDPARCHAAGRALHGSLRPGCRVLFHCPSRRPGNLLRAVAWSRRSLQTVAGGQSGSTHPYPPLGAAVPARSWAGGCAQIRSICCGWPGPGSQKPWRGL